MEIKAFQKNAKVSPKKIRFLLDAVKKMSPVEATDALYYMPHKPARILRAVIQSALANATNTFKIDANLLQFKTVSVDQGNKLKRYRAGGRGTAKPYAHKLAHISVVLETKSTGQRKGQESAEAAKPEPAKKGAVEAMKAADKGRAEKKTARPAKPKKVKSVQSAK